jgi:hypothetical protein
MISVAKNGELRGTRRGYRPELLVGPLVLMAAAVAIGYGHLPNWPSAPGWRSAPPAPERLDFNKTFHTFARLGEVRGVKTGHYCDQDGCETSQVVTAGGKRIKLTQVVSGKPYATGATREICSDNPDHIHAQCADNVGNVYIEKLMLDGHFHVEQLVRSGP